MPIETEADWLACADPREFAWHFKHHERELRFRWLLPRWGERIRHLMSVAEASFFSAVAECLTRGGSGNKPHFRPTVSGYLSRVGESPRDAVDVFVGELSRSWLIYALAGAAIAAARAGGSFHDQIARQFCDEFRDVAGNSFRPVVFDPAWRTETVVGLAVGIDEAEAYERLPILADALEEAGCADAQVLSHAREPGVHVRGCWLVDQVLGRW